MFTLQCDAKVAEDATFATDQAKQQQFLRTVMREVNPFLQPQAREPLTKLIAGLKGEPPPAPAVPAATPAAETPVPKPAE